MKSLDRHGVSAFALLLALTAGAAHSAPESSLLPTGQSITPTAAPGSVFQELNPNLPSEPDYTVGQAQTMAVSPDRKTLLILTSGYNLNNDASGHTDPATSTEFVFVFDISHRTPVQLQAVPVPNAFSGVAWAPDGSAFYVAGGQNDNVHIFKKTGGLWAESGAPVALNHTEFGVPQPAGNGLFSLPGFGAAVGPLAAGVGVTADGKKLVVANLENDSISVINLAGGNAVNELDLRPGRHDLAQAGVPGGEFPFWVAVKGSDTVYVSSERDREIVVVSLVGASPTIVARIPVKGSPNKMTLNAAGTRLYATADNGDALIVIDTSANKVIGQVQATAPVAVATKGAANGANPNSVALSPDERTAYVTNGGANSVAVIDVSGKKPVVTGLIPTGWYPTSVAVGGNGSTLYVVNAKSDTGPNPQETQGAANQYDLQRMKAGFLTLPTPNAASLAKLTGIVAQNNGFNLAPTANDMATMSFLRSHIKHVIYIVKENRTYDQILGDLPVGNGDPSLAMYGQATTPNFHAISQQFVDLDNFYCSGDASMNGWQWSTAGHVSALNEEIQFVNYGKGGGSYDSEGLSRDINVGLAKTADRVATEPVYGAEAVNDLDLLPGTANVVAPDGPSGEQGAGFIWNAAIRAKLKVRNYGFFLDLVRYESPATLGGLPVLRDPASTKTKVAFPAERTLVNLTDPYFRGFDNRLPDFYRYQEWAREFDQQTTHNTFPAFETVRFMHDHTGNFDVAIDGVNTPELQQADDDYAVGLLVDKIAHSAYASSTLVFVIEDDAQDGPDHVDSHRSTAYVAGPYVKQGAVVSTHYATTNMLRTIEDVLGLEHLSLHDAGVAPMTDAFDITQSGVWTYSATPAQMLLGTSLPILNKSVVKNAGLDAISQPLHDAAWWTDKSKGFTFAVEDENNAAAYNRMLWEGTMGDKPYPTTRSGLDLRQNRAELLKTSVVTQPAATKPAFSVE